MAYAEENRVDHVLGLARISLLVGEIAAEQLVEGAGEPSPRFVMTDLAARAWSPRDLHEQFHGARGAIENRIKEGQLDRFADRTTTRAMRANQLRLWFAASHLKQVAIGLGRAVVRFGLEGGASHGQSLFR